LRVTEIGGWKKAKTGKGESATRLKAMKGRKKCSFNTFK